MMKSQARFALLISAGLSLSAAGFNLQPSAFAGDDKPKAAAAADKPVDQSADKAAAKEEVNAHLALLKSLKGTWASDEKGPDGKPQGTLVFDVTAAGSVVIEKMFPGSAHEMVNTYHLNGDTVMVTHYCAQGVQPRMKLASAEGNTLKFDFLDCTNLSNPAEGHMATLEITIDGDTLTEKWGYMKDGKVGDHAVFVLHRQQG